MTPHPHFARRVQIDHVSGRLVAASSTPDDNHVRYGLYEAEDLHPDHRQDGRNIAFITLGTNGVHTFDPDYPACQSGEWVPVAEPEED